MTIKTIPNYIYEAIYNKLFNILNLEDGNIDPNATDKNGKPILYFLIEEGDVVPIIRTV